MKIGLISPVWFPVPPTGYGGTEWIVSLLADGLVEAGHDVTLFASGDSRTKARLRWVYDVAPSELIGLSLPEVHHALACFEHAAEFDIINDHSGPPAAAIGGAVATPVVHTAHGPLDRDAGPVYEQVARVAPRVRLISVSENQRRPAPQLPWVATCRNAIDLDAYPFSPTRGDYLLFLGRMSHDKGCHRAVRVARETGLPLKIAGKCREPLELEYFDAHVRPYLGDGIEYLGEISHEEKVALLQGARATLFPIAWEEPFGLVMVESLACGTPVIAMRYGAVPEVIDEGRTGIIVDSEEEFAEAIPAADGLDPADCRRSAEERFSATRMVADYARAFERVLAEYE